jgi:hypothetical protein
MKTKGQRSPRGSIYHIPWLLLTAMSCFAVATGYAQLNYLSDSRSVYAYATVDTNGFTYAPTISYSGDFSGSATPSTQFADFGINYSGTATAVLSGLTGNTGQSIPPETITATGFASQTSFLHPLELYYNSWEATWGTPPYSGLLPPGTWAYGTSSLQVSFNVSSPVAYSLTYEGLLDPLGGGFSLTLSSALQGVLINTNSGQLMNYGEYGVPINYSGTFEPGDIYTMNIYSEGELDDNGVMVDIVVVPEPSSMVLGGLALGVSLVCRLRRPVSHANHPRSTSRQHASGTLLPVVNQP